MLGGRAANSNGNSSSSSVAHRFAATCVTWYPVDSGAFVSGGADGDVKVWDANAEAAVASFSLLSRREAAAAAARNDSSGSPRVMCVAMSPASGASHALIAVGAAAGGGAGAISSAPPPGVGGGSALRLADARVGAFTHSLGGGIGVGGGGAGGTAAAASSSSSSSSSAAAVWCAAWSLSDPNQLLSGHADGCALAWDVRRADACVASLDLDDTRDARREERQMRRRQRQLKQKRREEESEAEEEGNGTATTTTAQLPLPPPPPPRTSASYRRAHDAAVTGLLPTPDGLSWVTAGADSAVRLWSASLSPSESFQNELHSLPETFNRARRPRQLAAARSPAALFHPSGSGVQVLPLPGGERAGYFCIGGGGGGGGEDGGGVGGGRHRGNLAPSSSDSSSARLSNLRRGVLLRGHVEAVHACAWSEARRELYTGGDDKTVLVWSSSSSSSAAAAAAAGVEEEEEEEEGEEEREESERRVRRRRLGGGGEDEDAWSD